jgi:Protein of unknown function (DUF3048) N-terminal domain/Protein of unknown function (DUF3048) C-terminal domain
MLPARSRLLWSGALLAACTLTLAACGGGNGASASTKKGAKAGAATTTTTAPIIAPLTGVLDPTGTSQTRPALTVKIDNTTNGLPQFGVDQADVVYEEIVESGITRLALMFQSHAPDKIGPVRSVRNTDQAIVWPVGGIFAYSGGAPVSVRSISQAPVNRVDENAAGDAMFRDPSRRRPFNLYGVADKLYAKGGKPVPPPPIFSYRATGAAIAGTPATAFNVGFMKGYDVDWAWDAITGSYKRAQFHQPAITGTGAQIAPQNVIVQFVNYVGGSGRGGAGAEGSEAEMIGTGPAWVFTGGQLVKGTWQRAAKEAPTRFVDASGADIGLAPGQTFVELLQSGYAVSVKG